VLLTAPFPSGQSAHIEAGNAPTAQENEAVQLPMAPSPSGQRARIEDLAAEVIKPASGRLSQIMDMQGDIPDILGVVSPAVPQHGLRSTVNSAQVSMLRGCCPPAMHDIVSQADELPIDDPVLLPLSPRTGHEDIDGSELATTPLEATPASMAVAALLLSSPQNVNNARVMQLPEQDSQTGDAELATTPIKATPTTVAVEALPLSSSRDVDGARALQLADQDSIAVPPSADQTKLVATELSQAVASLTSTPLPEFHELTSPGSLAHPTSQLQVYTRRPQRIVVA
jgi:hypothetical protein